MRVSGFPPHSGNPARPALTELLESALVRMDKLAVQRLYLESGLGPLQFSEQGVAPALERIGDRWDRGELSLSHVYMSGRICEDFINTAFTEHPPAEAPGERIALAVLEDFHLLGKRLVGTVLKSAGIRYLDYGTATVGQLLEKVQMDGVRILLISTLMLPSALKVRELRDGLDQLGIKCGLIVGGAPFRLDPGLYREVGADACCDNASAVLPALRRLCGGVP